jgi:hypothetical protein
VNEFGLIIVDLQKSRRDAKRPPTPAEVADLLICAGEYGDVETYKELQFIESELIDIEMGKLGGLLKEEYEMVWGLMDRFDTKDEPPLEEAAVSELAAEIRGEYLGLSSKIPPAVTALADALRKCHNSFILLHKNKGGPEVKEIQDFSRHETQFCEAARAGLTTYVVLRQNVYEGIWAGQHEAGEGSKKLVLTKAVMRELEASMTTEDLLQLELIELSIFRTYEHLFASLRNQLARAIRKADEPAARELQRQMKHEEAAFFGRLEDQRTTAREAMDVPAMRTAENRLSRARALNQDCVNAPLEEGLREQIEENIRSYRTNVKEISNEIAEAAGQVHEMRTRAAADLERKKYKPELGALSKKCKAEQGQGQKRSSPAFREQEEIIRRLMDAKRYDEAARAKEKYDAERAQAEQAQADLIKKRYDTLRARKKKEHGKNRDLHAESYQARLDALQQRKERMIDEQTKALASSISKQVQRNAALAVKLTPEDPLARKCALQKFRGIAQKLLRERGYPEIASRL